MPWIHTDDYDLLGIYHTKELGTALEESSAPGEMLMLFQVNDDTWMLFRRKQEGLQQDDNSSREIK